jgi:hypothetical protein
MYPFSPSNREIGENLKVGEGIEAWGALSPAFDYHSRVKPLAFQAGLIPSMVAVPSHAKKNMRMKPSKLLSLFWTHTIIQKRNPMELSLSPFQTL